MTRVLERPRTGPAAHALVIGAGDYPHLNGGVGPLTPDHEGMGQLGSPPVSARAICDWLGSEFHHSDKPLASVRLLLSDPTDQRYTAPGTATTHTVDRAEIGPVTTAVGEWFADGDTDEENLLLFYFCGHGIAQGTEYALLLSDFGRDPGNSLDGAVDFHKLHLGMGACKAARQCYFVDACRSSSDQLIATEGYAGRVLRQPRPRPRSLALLEAPIYYATLGGHEAYARTGQVSVFTDALLRGLCGLGADDAEGDWRVDTTTLQKALGFCMGLAFDAGGRRVQVPQSGSQSTFFLNYLDHDPQAPVLVGCDPDDAIAEADLSCTDRNGAVISQRPPSGLPEPAYWRVDLPAGRYEFEASFPGGGRRSRQKSATVRPVYRRITLEVSS